MGSSIREVTSIWRSVEEVCDIENLDSKTKLGLLLIASYLQFHLVVSLNVTMTMWYYNSCILLEFEEGKLAMVIRCHSVYPLPYYAFFVT